VNKRGKPDSWMPVDLFVEYLNLELKLIAEMKHLASMSSSMTVSFFVYSLRKEFEMHLGRPISGRHTSKKDVKYLADLIFSEGSISPTKPRSCPHQSLNLTGKGLDAVYSGAIPAFNQQLSDFQGPGGSSYQTAGKKANTPDDSGDTASNNSCDGSNASEAFESDTPQGSSGRSFL
jgi:hypothetical protein